MTIIVFYFLLNNDDTTAMIPDTTTPPLSNNAQNAQNAQPLLLRAPPHLPFSSSSAAGEHAGKDIVIIWRGVREKKSRLDAS